MSNNVQDIMVGPKKAKALQAEFQQLLKKIRSSEFRNAAKFYSLNSEFLDTEPQQFKLMKLNNPFGRFDSDVLFTHYKSPWMEDLKRLSELHAQVQAFSKSYPSHSELKTLLARLNVPAVQRYIKIFDAIREWSANPLNEYSQKTIKQLLPEPKKDSEKLRDQFSKEQEAYEFTLEFEALSKDYERFKALSLETAAKGVDEGAIEKLKKLKTSIDSSLKSEDVNQCSDELSELIKFIGSEALAYAAELMVLNEVPQSLQAAYRRVGEKSSAVKRAKRYLRSIGSNEEGIISYSTRVYNARIDRQRFEQTFHDILGLTYEAKKALLQPGVLAPRLTRLQDAVDETAQLFVKNKLKLKQGKSAQECYENIQEAMQSLKDALTQNLDFSNKVDVEKQFKTVSDLSSAVSGAVNLYYMRFEEDQKCECLQSVMSPIAAVKTSELVCGGKDFLINKLSVKVSPIVKSSERARDATEGELSKIFKDIAEKAGAEQKRGEQIEKLYELGTAVAESQKALLKKRQTFPEAVTKEKEKVLAKQLAERIGGEAKKVEKEKPKSLFKRVKEWFVFENEPSSSARMQSGLGVTKDDAKKPTLLQRFKKSKPSIKETVVSGSQSLKEYFVQQEGKTFDQVRFEKALKDPEQLKAKNELDTEKPVLHVSRKKTRETGPVYQIETPLHCQIDFYAEPKLYRTNDGSPENFKHLALIAQKTGYKTLGVEKLPEEYQAVAAKAFREVGMKVTGYEQKTSVKKITPESRSRLVK